jgi:sugar phosphate permease
MLLSARRLGAVAILVTGAVHLQQLTVQDFRGIPTIQVLFVLNVIGSVIVGLSLLAPLARTLPSRWTDPAVALLAAVGLTIAVGSLVGLFISESQPLFGLRTRHYSAAAVVAITAEAAAVLFLTPVLVGTAVRARHRTGDTEERALADRRG